MENTNMKIIPTGASLVVLVGPSGAGKGTFTERHFEAREVVSTDALRVELTGDMARQDKNDEVYTEFYRRIAAKIAVGQRVVADATHLRDKDRRATAEIGIMMDVPVTYVVINRSVESKLQTGGWRLNVHMKGGLGLIETHEQTFVANEKKILAGDSFPKGRVLVVDTRVDEFRVANAIPRHHDLVMPWLELNGYNEVRVVADVHGNLDGFEKAIDVPDSTFLLFLGDLVDYDARGIDVVRRLVAMMRNGRATSIRGNHEKKIFNWIMGERGDGFRGTVSHGNDSTVNVVKAMSGAERAKWEQDFISMVEMSPDWIQIGRWLFTHGAAHHTMWDNELFRSPKNSKMESFSMYGETSGKFNNGYPERLYNWVDKIPPRNRVVVGHAVLSVDDPVRMQRAGGVAIFLDTGSSKDITFDNGNMEPTRGHLSWLDFTLDRGHGLLMKEYGRE
jgi:protein phosphatase